MRRSKECTQFNIIPQKATWNEEDYRWYAFPYLFMQRHIIKEEWYNIKFDVIKILYVRPTAVSSACCMDMIYSTPFLDPKELVLVQYNSLIIFQDELQEQHGTIWCVYFHLKYKIKISTLLKIGLPTISFLSVTNNTKTSSSIVPVLP